MSFGRIMKTFDEFINENELLESHNAVEISSIPGSVMCGKKVKSIIRKGSKIWKKLGKGSHEINHKNENMIPCEVLKIEKKRNKKTKKIDYWISVKSKDDKGKESYFYDWANEFMNDKD